ncbi:MAG: aminodeoxychorismate/anthranilate synthase component II [Pseudomonadota bacterium]|nr:aminodeoxychorismate/anthranilate synthase component II [Pseudomonadota bacterium]
MFLLIDNYDSFTYNLRHYLGELGAEVEVCRNDAITVDDIQSMSLEGLVISPGPCDPDRAGICLELIEKVKDEMPILGVCLGHQCIGQVFGGKIVLAPKPMHGKVSDIFHQSDGLMNGIPSPFRATRYHSLAIEPGTLPSFLSVMATSEDGVIQGISHKELPIFGVQFHPESIASEHGHKLIQNFLDIVKARPGNRKVA